MKCEICKTNEASVHFKQVCEGKVKEIFVCEECAASKGFDVQSPMSLTNFLFGVGGQEESEASGEDKTCPGCGVRLSEFRKSSRLGCPACYEAFSDELDSLLAAMHKGRRHVGKVPAGERISTEIAQLQSALEEAVSQQRFEEAAALRDQISELKGTSGKSG